MNVMTTRLKTTVAGLALVTGLASPTSVFAQEVKLTSTDGTMSLSGQLMGIESDNYIIRTALGDLRVATATMICEGDACPTFEDVTADITIVGSEAIGIGMMPLLMSGFAASLDAEAEVSNPAAGEALVNLIGDNGFGDEIGTYLVSSSGDDDAFNALLEGRTDIGMAARRITQAEARALRADGSGSMVNPNQERIIAVDSMVVATHASNPVQGLTEDQLRGIFSGQIRDWSQVGGNPGPITVVSQPEGSASYEYFMDYVYDGNRPNFLPQAIAADDQAMSNVMFHDKNAIGYLGYAFQRGAKPVALYDDCGIAAIPDAFSAKTEEYPLSRRMYLYSRADNQNPKRQEFLDYVTSTAADGVIGKSGFIDLGILRRTQDASDPRFNALTEARNAYDVGFEGEVMQEMLEKMDGFDRLSTTFRFRTGSFSIDERGHLDMMRLMAYLKTVPAGTEITFVGFTDDVGAFDGNRHLAEKRAEAILADLFDMSGNRFSDLSFATAGFGEIAPSACNSTDRGRGINRRVEVWISNSVAG